MVYNLDERATLFDNGQTVGEGRLRDMIALALTWGEPRFGAARIETPTQEVYGPEGIARIARESGIEAAADEGHPS